MGPENYSQTDFSPAIEIYTLQWRHNGSDSVSNHQPCDCLLNRLFRRISKKTSKLRVTGLCAGNSPGTGEFPAQMASYAENVSIWWRHHEEMPPSCNPMPSDSINTELTRQLSCRDMCKILEWTRPSSLNWFDISIEFNHSRASSVN